MTVAGLWRIFFAGRAGCETTFASSLLIPMSSAAVVVPAMLVHFELGKYASLAVLTALLASGACWFVGECSRLRLLEDIAHSLTGRDLMYRARNVRWGSYVVVLLLALGVGQALWNSRQLGSVLPQLSGAFIVMTSVSLMILSLLSALLCGRISQLAQEQAQYIRAYTAPLVITPYGRVIVEKPAPDEPDWFIN